MNGFDLDRVESDVRDRREEWIDVLTDLVSIPSVNPPGDTTEIADYLTDLLDDRGVPYEVVAPKERMPNVAAQFDGEAGDPEAGPHLVYNGHLDTFPVSAREEWDRDPFSGAVEDGKVHGLGVADMHAGFTASLAAALYLFENRDRFSGRVSLTATSDEETGSEWGADYLLEHHPEYRGDAMINGEPSSNGIVRFGDRGALWLEIEVRGESAHAAYPRGRNAIDALVGVIDALRTRIDAFVNVPDRERRLIREARAEMDAAFGDGATDRVLDAQVSPNVIEGGEQVNLTAERATAKVDVRLPIGTEGSDVVDALREIGRESPAAVSVDVLHHTDPTYSDVEDRLLRTVQSCAGRVRDGPEPAFSCGLAMTDGRFYRLHGVPTALYGPTPHNVGHQNEYVTVADFMDVVATHATAGAAYLDGP